MRSLATKLTLAFLVVGLSGALLMALLVGRLTQRGFDQFVFERYQADLVDDAVAFYEQNGSWEGVGDYFHSQFEPMPGAGRAMGPGGRIGALLVDADGQIVVGGQGGPRRLLLSDQSASTVPITVNDQVVGYLVFETPSQRDQATVNSPEALFRSRVNRAILWSALGAVALALLLGLALAGTISRPVHDLTQATGAVARGQLGLQVPVRTDDELGDLTQSFNQMSSDLAKAAQLRQQMTADIAHDLRTPLTVILGYAEALNDGKLKGDPEIYQALHQQARHLTRLVEDLRTLSLADAGQLSLRRQPVDPVSLLEHTVLAYAGQAEARGVTLRLENGGDIPAVTVDPDRMVQVLGNLVSNALRHTPPGGEIVLSAEGPDNSSATPIVQLRVRDSGPGINPEDLPHIFDRFYRGDKARPSDGASGLGLAIARSLVEAHGGRIAAESEPGRGATFVISLPLTPA